MSISRKYLGVRPETLHILEGTYKSFGSSSRGSEDVTFTVVQKPSKYTQNISIAVIDHLFELYSIFGSSKKGKLSTFETLR